MFNAIIDDDDFFTPTASASNLASLFSPTQTAAAPSLTYTAPKQPQRDTAEQKPRGQNKLICCKTIQLFKISDDKQIPHGKYGIAIIGDPAINSYDLILYKTRQQILSNSKLNSNFKYTQQDNQAKFVDDQKQHWQVQFDELKEAIEFEKELQKSGAVIEVAQKRVVMTEQVEVLQKVDAELSDGTGAQARANILDRISKVGQSMLPSGKGVELSESEPDEVVTTKKVLRKPKRVSTTEKEMIEPIEPSQQYMVPVAATSIHQQPYSLMNQFVPNQMMQCLPTQVLAMNDPMSIYFAESRTHNSEIRMNISQLSNKLETVMNELHGLRATPKPTETDILNSRLNELERKLNGASQPDVDATITALQTKLTEKETIEEVLKSHLQSKSEELKALQNKLAAIEKQTHDVSNKSEEIERLQAKLAEFEVITNELATSKLEEIKRLENKIVEFEMKNKEVENKLAENEMKLTQIADLEKLLSTKTSELDKSVCDNTDLATENAELNRLLKMKVEDINSLSVTNVELSATVDGLQKTVDNLKLKLDDFGEHYKERSVDKLQSARDREDQMRQFGDQVKHSMNIMYQSILDKFDDEGGGKDFKRTLTQSMKNATYEIIEQYKINLTKGEVNDAPPVPEFEVTV